MIEDVQDEVQSLLEDNLSTELSSLESPSGGVSLTLTAPQEYHINFDPNFTIPNQYPACFILPGATEHNDALSNQYHVINEHEIAVVFLIQDQDVDLLQRKRSRYAEAARNVLKVNQQSGVMRMTYDYRFIYDRTLRDESKSAFLGSVWVTLSVQESEKFD